MDIHKAREDKIVSPEVSIITVVKNDARGLCNTLQNISDQDYFNFECLIIFGESIDNTREIAEKFIQTDSRFLLVPESSHGIYSAMNDGIRIAKGKFLNFMNAGDIFWDSQSLGKLVAAMNSQEADLVIGGFVVDNNELRKSSKTQGKFTAKDFAFNRNWGNHQAMLFRRKAPDIYYDLRYPIASDFRFVLEHLSMAPGNYISEKVARIASGGISDTRLISGYVEKFRIRRIVFEDFRTQIWNAMWTIAAIAKVVFKRSLHRS